MSLFADSTGKLTIIATLALFGQSSLATVVQVNCATSDGKTGPIYFEAKKAGIGDKTGTIFVQGRRFRISDNQPQLVGDEFSEAGLIFAEEMDKYRELPCEKKVMDVRLSQREEILNCGVGSSLVFTNYAKGKPVKVGRFNACDNFHNPIR